MHIIILPIFYMAQNEARFGSCLMIMQTPFKNLTFLLVYTNKSSFLKRPYCIWVYLWNQLNYEK